MPKNKSQRPPAALDSELLQLFERAMRLQAMGKLDAALDYYDRILRAYPNNADALFMRAQTLMQAGRYREAITWAKRASTSKPNNSPLRFLIAYNYYNLNRPFEAIRQLKKALKIEPGYSMARLLLARAYCDIDRINEARECLDAGSINTNSPTERLTHVNVLARLGRVDEAKEMLLTQIGDGQALAESLYELTGFTGKHWAPEHTEQIKRLLADPKRSPDERTALHFSAARIANHEGRYDDAFSHYSQANSQSDSPFAIATYRQTIQRIIRLFTPDLFRVKAGFGDPSETPIFVIGLPRAGKSILESALCRHPQVHGAGEISLHTLIEGGLILGLDAELPNGFEEKIEAMDSRESQVLAKTYLEEIVRYNRKSRFVVNTLPQNFQNIGVLHVLFPNAKYIHIRRDPIDTCLFCFTKNFQHAHTYSQDLAVMGMYYQSYREIMDHWNSVIPDRIIDVDYEKFVTDPALTLKSVLEFLDLDLDQDVLGQIPTAGRGTTEAGYGVGPVNESYVQYWKNYERHIGPLIDSLGDLADV